MDRQLWRFAGVGVVVTIVHMLVAMLAKTGLGLPAQMANLSGFSVALCMSYVGHAFITFKATTDHARQMPRFVITAVAGLATSSAITYLVYSLLGGSFALAMVVMALVVPPVTYVVSKYWVFNEQRSTTRGWQGLLISLGISAIFLIIYWGRLISHDVAWYLVATQKWLFEGARLYVDLIEVNPPLNFYLTIPAVLLSNTLNISPTNAQYLVVAILMTVSLTWIWDILERDQNLPMIRKKLILVLVGFATVLASAKHIAQREHMMLLFILPYVFGYLVLATPDKGKGALARAGFAAIGLCIKPHFMIYPIMMTLLMIWRRKSLWPIVAPANLVIVAVGAIYVGMVMLLHPEYLNEIVPMAVHVYGAYGYDAQSILTVAKPLVFALFIVLGFLVLIKPDKIMGFDVLIVAVIAASISYIMQWTGYAYQILPAHALILIACIWVIGHTKRLTPVSIWAMVAIAYIAIIQINAGYYQNRAYVILSPHLDKQESGYGLMLLSNSVYAGFPIALETEANWISRYPTLWLIPGAVNYIANNDCDDGQNRCVKHLEILSKTRKNIISGIETGMPDILIFDRSLAYITDNSFTYNDFLSQDPRYAKLIADYEIKERLPHFTIMQRKPDR